jgi:hypothetical protein
MEKQKSDTEKSSKENIAPAPALSEIRETKAKTVKQETVLTKDWHS